MKTWTQGTAMLMLFSFGATGCVRNLPPPPAPAHEMPKSIGSIPPEVEGKGRIVVDVTNGPAQVDEVLAQATSAATNGQQTYVAYGEVTRPVCLTTPCAVNFDYGQHNLRFVSKSDDQLVSQGTVDVGQNDSVFRHTMGEHSSGGAVHALGATSTILGVTGALLGGTLLLLGALDPSTTVNPDGTTSTSASPLTGAGAITLGIGAGLLALGIGMMVASPVTQQEGSSSQFSLDDSKPADTGKAHVRLADDGHSL